MWAFFNGESLWPALLWSVGSVVKNFNQDNVIKDAVQSVFEPIAMRKVKHNIVLENLIIGVNALTRIDNGSAISRKV